MIRLRVLPWTLCLVASTTHADQRAESVRHYNQAVRHVQRGEYREAITEFEESNRIRPQPVLYYNIAAAYRSVGESASGTVADLQSAIANYSQYLAVSPDASDTRQVRLLIAELRAKIASFERRERADAPPSAAKDLGAEPEATRRTPPTRESGEDEGARAGGGIDPQEGSGKLAPQPAEETGQTPQAVGKLFARLWAGTGIGGLPEGSRVDVAYIYKTGTGRYESLAVDSPGGVAFEHFHMAVELGVNVRRNIVLSLLVRVGYAGNNNADSSENPPLGRGTRKAAPFTLAAVTRLGYQFGEGRLRPFLHLGLGLGSIRHVIDISGAETPERPLADLATAEQYMATSVKTTDPVNEVCPDHRTCVDAVVAGPVLIGGGGGLWLDLVTFRNGGVGLVAELGALVAFGGQWALHVDLEAGIGVHFL